MVVHHALQFIRKQVTKNYFGSNIFKTLWLLFAFSHPPCSYVCGHPITFSHPPCSYVFGHPSTPVPWHLIAVFDFPLCFFFALCEIHSSFSFPFLIAVFDFPFCFFFALFAPYYLFPSPLLLCLWTPYCHFQPPLLLGLWTP